MSSVVIPYRFRLKRDTAAAFTTADTLLLEGEIGYELDTGKFKIGDGSTTWTSLGYYGTDQVPEGATNLYFTAQRDYDAAKAMLVAGSNVTITPDDGTKTLILAAAGGGGGGTVTSVVGGTHISVDSTDPANPIVNVSGISTAGYDEGTSFPLTPALQDKFYRTDLNLLCYYDGTRWLTVHEYEVGIGSLDQLANSTSNLPVGRWPVRQDFGIYLTKWRVVTFINGTNNGSNYRTIILQRRTAANASADIASINTATDAPSTWNDHSVNIDAPLDASAMQLQATTSSAGSPGGLYAPMTLCYRLIVT